MGTLPKMMQGSVEAGTKGKFQFIEQKLERIEDLLGDGHGGEDRIIGFLDEVQRVQQEGCLVEDFGNVSHTQDVDSIGVAQNLSGTLETGLDIAMKFLSTIGFVKPEIAAGLNLLATARALYKNYTESDIKDKIEKLVQEKIDDEYLNEYEGIIEIYTSSIAFLNGIGVQKLTDIELNLLWDTIKIFHSVVFIGKFRKRISDLINDCERFRDFVKLMQYIEKYMTLVFLRDVVFVMVCKVLEVNSSKTLRVLKAMKSLISYQRIQDTNLLHFLVTPKKKTIYLNFLYSPNKWPTVQQLLHEYFFCDTKKTNDLSFLCEGEYVMTPVQYENSCLFFADVRYTWLRWSYAHEADTQSRLRFVKHEIEGKIYFQIFSVKWPQYFARMGNDGWWVRGRCDEEPDNYGLWEIIQFDDNGDELFMLAPKDSKANFMRVDVFGRIFGSRCMPGLHTFFQIKAQFFDALEEFAKTDDE